MSSSKPIPTTQELLDAFAVGAQSHRPTANTRTGGRFDLAAGMGALIWARVAVRDREIFRGVYFDGCRGTLLDERIAAFGGPARNVAQRGTGTAVLSYDVWSNGSSPGLIPAGTRIAVMNGASVRYYRTAQDFEPVGADFVGQFVELPVAIEADELGEGYAVDSSKVAVAAKFEDTIYDPHWMVQSIACSDGYNGEEDSVYLARYRAWKKAQKPGYADYITRKMLDCGASRVALFESDYISGEDYGINRIFVETSTASVLQACRLAVDSCVPFGCTTTVGTMTRAPLVATITLRMSVDPSRFDNGLTHNEVVKALSHAISGSQTAYVFRRDVAIAELTRALPDLQKVEFASPTPTDTDVGEIVRTGAGGNLTIYDATNISVNLTIAGPS